MSPEPQDLTEDAGSATPSPFLTLAARAGGRSARPGELTDVKWGRSVFNKTEGAVEVAWLPDGGVALRDSKHPEVPALIFTKEEWDAFVAGVRAGEFGDL